MHRKKDSHAIDILFVLTAALSTVLLCLLLIAAGVGVYRNVLKRSHATDALRTPVAYLTQKVRQHAGKGAVSIGELTGTPALILDEEIGGTPYVTYLYASGGSLRELFTAKDHPGFSADAGSIVTPLQSLSFERKGEAVCFRLEGEDVSQAFLLHTVDLDKEDRNAKE